MSLYTKTALEDNIRTTKKRLEKEGIKVPQGFCIKCYSKATMNGGETNRYFKSLGAVDIYAAIKLAEFWKLALKNQDEFYKLVVSVIYSLYAIQCVALNNNPECPELYLGQYVELNENHPLATAKRGTITSTVYSVGAQNYRIN